MDCWPNLELTPKTLRKFVINMDSMKKFLDNQEQCNLFFNRFPFDQLFNFTIMDQYSIRLCVKILEVFITYDQFCSVDERVNCVIEFVLINLTQATEDCKEVLALFQLLSKMLHRNIRILDSSFKNVFDRERILEVMLKITNFKSVQKTNFTLYSSVLNLLIEDDFSDSLNYLLAQLFEKLKDHNILKVQFVICKLVLNSKQKIKCKEFENIWSWLVQKSSVLIESSDIELLDNLIYCLFTFIGNWANVSSNEQEIRHFVYKFIEELIQNLTKHVGQICMLTAHKELRPGCLNLLKFILMKFLNEENLTSDEQDKILKSVNYFPEDIEKWPKSDIDLFFCICQICTENKKLIWKPLDVLSAMMRCFYNRKNVIKNYVLKAIYYLYPVLINDLVLDFSIEALGDDLLNYFERVCTVSYLYSYNSYQLKWILARATKPTKLKVITQWLNKIENNHSLESVLTTTIQNCHAEVILLQLMMDDNNLGNEIGFKYLRSASLLKQMTNYEISSVITLILPFTIDKPAGFYNLLLAEPGISLDSYDSALICSLIGAVIPSLNDVQVLKGACAFSCKLLCNNKDNPYAIRGFCRNATNIKHIIDTIDKVDDETGVEIIRLLKILLLLQQKNKIKLEFRISEDFKIFIKGSQQKIRKSLLLLYHSINYKDALIVVNTNYILEIYHILLDFSVNPVFQPVSNQCIILLLKRIPWLAQTVSTSVYAEMMCLSCADLTFQINVLKMLDTWLTLLRSEPHNGFCPIPETAIRSFISRLNISQMKKQRYFTILDDLSKRANYKPKANVFSSIN